MRVLRLGSVTLVVCSALIAGACGSADDKKAINEPGGGEAGQASQSGGNPAGEGGSGGAEVPTGNAGEAAGQAGGTARAGQGEPCGGSAECADGLRCAYDVCIPIVACGTADGCGDDQYCDRDDFCVPYGLPEDVISNRECVRQAVLGPFDVELQCSFETPPADQLPASNQVMVTPSVADLDLDHDPSTRAPSLVFATYASQTWPGLLTGDLRVIDGRSCELQQTLMGADEQVTSTAQPALADLDADGRIEIVVPRSPAYGGLIAFEQADDGKYRKRWTSAFCDGAGGRTPDTTNQNGQYMAGVSIHDLDDDGVPEIVLGAVVYAADGCVLDSGRGVVDLVSGHIPVVADLDGDGVVELSTGDQLLEWREGRLEPAASFAGTHARGFTAVADFGDFGEGPDVADIAVISAGAARIENVLGQVVFGPFTVPGLAHGGPPTIGDFDGDGEPEFAAAGANVYAVLDPECDAEPLPNGCEARGVRWSKPSQDLTSNVTGSAVFDFEGDEAAEAVYADECFLRIYDGASGAVKWSIARPSGTANEYPLVADVDGDFHSELVIGHNDWPSGCAGSDALFPSTAFAASHGLFVYSSVGDGWAGSRSLWNQHAYSVTNINDDGRVPRSRDWQPNWTVAGLNDFRQNVQLGLAPLAGADLTASCRLNGACSDDGVVIDCNVCNRGAQGVDAGLSVSFAISDADPPICEELTSTSLLPGACTAVTCSWSDPPRDAPVDLAVRVDAAGAITECFEQNNAAFVRGVRCP
jgi:hypothetical protein